MARVPIRVGLGVAVSLLVAITVGAVSWGALAVRPDDRLAAVLERRCRSYLASPPPEGWNGIYVTTEK